MAYTGTGTEEDPFLVSVFSDFLYCISVSGAYIKIINDIDTKDDPDYIGDLTSPITLQCRKIYADDRKTINGITVVSDHFMKKSNSTFATTDIVNINFLNCAHQIVSTSNFANKYTLYGEYGGITFTECSLSISISSGVYVPLLSNNSIYLVRSSAYFEIISVGMSGLFYVPKIYESSIHIKGGTLYNDLGVCLYDGFRSSIILENVTINTTGSHTMLSHCDFVYIAIVNPTIIKNCTAGLSYSSNCLLACDSDLIVSQNNNLKKVTLNQMKDKEYLHEIGFLP